MSLPRRAQGAAGFTLIEVLIALALLALLISLVSQALRLPRNASAFDVRAERNEHLAATRNYLENRLRSMLPRVERDPSGIATLLFAGSPDAMRFVSAAPSGPAGGGVFVFDLQAGGDLRGNGLSMRQERYRPVRASDATVWSHEVLPAGVRVSFRYFGPSQAGQKADWFETWPRRDTLPLLIELTIDDRRTSRQERLVVAPAAGLR